jgi:hypothetical protein
MDKCMTQHDELRIIKNFLDMMPKTYRKRNHNWVVISHILLYRTSTSGCTSSCDKCRQLGIDPYGYSLESEGEKYADNKR